MFPEGVIQYGRDEPPPERQRLRAGPLTLVWEDGDLRYCRLGETEVLRRVYVAIRDRNWRTAANDMSNLNMETGADTFHITFDVENRLDDIHFTWRGEITGSADGSICFAMDGIAHSTFLKNRIGFCVLHPDDIAGVQARVIHVDGSIEEGRLPERFVPDQPVLPFAEMRGMAHEVRPGIWAHLSFTGDIFEMEDQRNWTDASYKTFSTPLRIPYPVEIPVGTRIQQSVTLSLDSDSRTIAVGPAAVTEGTVNFSFDPYSAYLPISCLGLGVASHSQALSDLELERMTVLAPAHLRVDLTLADPDYPTRLRLAAREAAALGAGQEIALFVSPDRAAAEFEGLRAALDGLPTDVARWLVFPVREEFRGGTPLREVLEPARAILPGCSTAPIYSGTNTDFIFLARNVPPLDLVDGLTFAITPQVHAFDNASIVETLGTQGQAVANARALAEGRPVCVSPITLRMRHNPYATGAEALTPPGQLPTQVDPRQMSLLAAGWTVTSIKYLAEAGAVSATYFETTGWRGVMETAAGSAILGRFRSIPGSVFPVYHVLADVAEFRAGVVIPSRSSNRLVVDGLALLSDESVRVIIANLSGDPQSVIVSGMSGEAALHLIDATNAEDAMRSPEGYRDSAPAQRWPDARELQLALPPFGVARLDGQR
jgi:hypothetical protein